MLKLSVVSTPFSLKLRGYKPLAVRDNGRPGIKCRTHLRTTGSDSISGIEDPQRIGVCFDSCHVFAAGYDLRTQTAYDQTMQTFDTIIGFDRLYLIHLNDALKPLGSMVDRHAHIGQGHIGIQGFTTL